MSTSRGIFETFDNQSSDTDDTQGASVSPFAAAPPAPQSAPMNGAPSPFAIAPTEAAVPAPSPSAKKNSPFAIVEDDESAGDSKTIRIPERRKAEESPFQVAEPQGFGYEAPAQQARVSPFGQAPGPAPQHAPSPFTIEPTPAPMQAQPAPAPSPFGGWPQAEVAPRQENRPAQIVSQHHQQPAPVFSHTPSPGSSNDSDSDSYSIKQLELRAIFGVDREMNHEEIVQRARTLPGIRQIARVSEGDVAAVDALKGVIANLGFGNGAIRLYSGSVPIEFIREGKTLLAVQTDGGFAPGVRETLMLVARELGR